VASAEDRTEKVKVPLEALGELLKRYPDGRILSEKDWNALLESAGVKSLSELGPKATEEKPPVSWNIGSCELEGRVTGDQVTFTGDALVRVLESKSVLVPLPLASVGAREVTVDGAVAELVRGAGGYSVVLGGPGERRVRWTYSMPVGKLEERGAGAFILPLLKDAAAARLRLTLDGDLEVTSKDCPLTVEHPSATTSVATAACGGRSAVWIEFRPRTAEASATPYVTADDVSCFVVGRGLVQLELVSHFAIHRAARDRFSIGLPAGFTVRTLDAYVRDGNERAAPFGGTWAQRGDTVELALPKARQGELAVVIRAELVAPQEGSLDLALASYPGSARSSGLVGIARGEDMTVEVTNSKALERADLDTLRSNVAGMLRVYRHGSQASNVSVSLKPTEPKVLLELKAAEVIKDRELMLEAHYTFHVLEGKVFQVSCELPESWRIDRTHVPAKNELRTEKRDGKTVLVIDLEGGLRAGTALTVTVVGTREVPLGIATEPTLPVPLLAGSPAQTTQGYFACAVDPAFRLRGDVKGLLPIPADALGRHGLSVENVALGFKVDRPDYSGTLTLTKKETRLGARTLIYYQVDERTIATDVRFDLDVQGAPVDSVEIVLPKGAGKLARFEGDDVAEQSQVAEEGGNEKWRVRFQSPKAGKVTLLVHFDTQVQGFDKAEGFAKTKTTLPVVHMAESCCERERGQVAVFSGDATEISAEPANLRALEITDVEVHPAVKPAGRPLCAFTYVGLDWKLGIEITRHEPLQVLSAIVEQLTIESSFGRDGVSRHTAKFRCKNLSHQFFDLKVPEGAVIWSVLVDGVGVKPAALGDSKLIPLTKASAPDQPVEVAVSYEVQSGALGRFGSGALVSPTLLLKSGGEAIPVLRTTWSLSLPDEFRYFEFAGNAQGASAAVDQPLVVQLWQSNPQAFTCWAAFFVLVLAGAASETWRARVVGMGQAIGRAGAGIPRRLRSRESASRKQVIVVAGLGLLIVTIVGGIVLSSERRTRAPFIYSLFGDEQESSITHGSGGAGATAPAPGSRPVFREGERAEQEERKPAWSINGRKTLLTPPQKKAEASKKDAMEDVPPADAPAPPPPAEATPAVPGRTLENAASTAGLTLENEIKGGSDLKPQAKPVGRNGLADNFDKAPMQIEDKKEEKQKEHRALSQTSAFGEKGLSSLVLALPYVGKTWTLSHEGGPADINFSYIRSDLWMLTLALLAILGFAAGLVLPRKTGMSFIALLVLGTVFLSTVPYVLFPQLTGGLVNAVLGGLFLSAPVVLLLSIDRARLRRVRLLQFVPPRTPAPLILLAALLYTSQANAQDHRVYVPYDPDHPEKKTDKVFVPDDVYEQLWRKAHPEAKSTEKPTPPAPYAMSSVNYEGAVSAQGLKLNATFRVQVLQEGWVEVPLGLEGASILSQTIAPEGAKLRPSATGTTLLAQGPKTFDVTLTLLLPLENGVYSAGAVRTGAAVVKVSTTDAGMAIRVLGAQGGQNESADGKTVDASLGSAARIRIAYG
ncbi:MAG TPA: hypothetical protein VFF73_19755, partial [Planctomycetota bacterium]|nr:hypothetical protein [Planctomycetota bacterium]